eukprot:UN01175
MNKSMKLRISHSFIFGSLEVIILLIYSQFGIIMGDFKKDVRNVLKILGLEWGQASNSKFLTFSDFLHFL